jgi:hypothetical protein
MSSKNLRPMPLAITFLALLLAGTAQSLSAQTEIAPPDLSVPESPAFTLLGVTPQNVTRPATPKAFQTALLNSVDSDGKLQSGVSIDTSPYLLYAGNMLTIDQYRRDAAAQILARTNLSLASTKEASGSAEHLAAGLHITLFDAGDPRKDTELDTCFDAALALPKPTLPGEVGGSTTVTDVSAETARKIEDCRTASARRNWNASSWNIGGGQAWLSSDGTKNHIAADGGGLWTSAALRLRKRAQVIVHARWRENEHVTAKDNSVTDHDKRLIGVRLRFGSPTLNGSVEAATQSDQAASKTSRKRVLLLGVEQRVAEGVWLDVSLGRELSRDAGAEHFLARGSFKWSFNPKSTRSPVR